MNQNKSGFRSYGIYPVNTDIILSTLSNGYNKDIPTTDKEWTKNFIEYLKEFRWEEDVGAN